MIEVIDHETGEKDTFNEMPLYGMERIMGLDPELPEAATRIEFKLYDDDGELCATGTLPDDEACENQAAALRYGETCWGATIIKVKRDASWVQEIA